MKTLTAYKIHLLEAEKSPLTVDKYMRDADAFLVWLDGRALEKTLVMEYKAALLDNYAAASVNSMLSSVNSYLNFIGRPDCRVKTVKQQRRLFCAEE